MKRLVYPAADEEEQKLISWQLRIVLSAAVGLALVISVSSSAARPISEREFDSAKVYTDGRFGPGTMETIRVSGFPGMGRTEIVFFPSAICEASCGSVSRFAGRTDKTGSGQLRVRVPGYFFNARKQRTYFRHLERIDLQVLWTGPNEDEFAVGYPKHRPVFRRPSSSGG